jgi:hypothetical protein
MKLALRTLAALMAYPSEERISIRGGRSPASSCGGDK